MNATRIALKNVGEWVTIGIASAEQVPVGRFPEYSFIGVDGDEQHVDLRVPKASADKQLARLNLTLADTVGAILKFSRGENKTDASKPYWNIDVVAQGNGTSGGRTSAVSGNTQPAAPTPPAPAKPVEEREKGSAIYKRVTQFVLDDILPLYRKAGVTPTATDIHAMVATVYIAATKNGH